MPTDIYTASDTWTCPAGVSTVDVECWAGGGAGSGGYSGGGGAGGGGGGAYSKKTGIAVTPTTGYTVTVGSGGSTTGTTQEGNPVQAASGNDSWFSTSGTVLAKGGGGGWDTQEATLGDGGLAASGVGDTKYSGGSGALRSGTPAWNGGGGGGGAGSAGNGGNASTTTGGSAGSGSGGSGGTGTSGTGGDGNTLGGGGAGGGTSAAGGSGARGEVRVTYSILSNTGNFFMLMRA